MSKKPQTPPRPVAVTAPAPLEQNTNPLANAEVQVNPADELTAEQVAALNPADVATVNPDGTVTDHEGNPLEPITTDAKAPVAARTAPAAADGSKAAEPAAAPAAPKPLKGEPKKGDTFRNPTNGIVSIRGVVFAPGGEHSLTEEEANNTNITVRIKNAVSNGLLVKV